MTLVSALLAAVAVALFLQPPESRTLSRLSPVDTTAEAPPPRRSGAIAGVLAGVAAVAAGGLLGGAAGAVVVTAAVIAAAAVVRLIRLRRRSRAAAAARADIAHACRVLAGQLRVGRIPAEALRIAAADCPVLAQSAALVDLGSDPVPGWRVDSERPGHGGLLVLARAWQVSTRSGAPLAPALERVSEALSEDVAVERIVCGEASAARATGKVMSALPACGIGIGYLIGGRPLQFLVAGPTGWVCLLLGVVLAAAGVLWIDWLSRSVGDRIAVT